MRKHMLLLAVCLLALSACNFNTENQTPTVDAITEQPLEPLPERLEDATETAPPSATPSPSPTITAVEEVAQVATLTPSPSPIPTNTLPPTPTPGPWLYVIETGDTLSGIITKPPHNYSYDPNVIDAVIRLNSNIFSADVLPPVGSEILVPRPTQPPLPANIPTADPNAVDQVAQANPALNMNSEGVIIVPPDNSNITPPPMRPNTGLSPGSYVGCHIVREGETVAGIIEQYPNLNIEIFSRLNADLNYSRCDFSIASGGPNCNPVIVAGTCVNVSLPTPTPTFSPTPSGEETPTPTPTYRAPQRLTPVDGATISPGIITLMWSSVGILDEGEVYVVQVTDTTSGAERQFVTRDTSYRLPADLIPNNGETHTINWQVFVALRNGDIYIPVGGGTNQISTFYWQSR